MVTGPYHRRTGSVQESIANVCQGKYRAPVTFDLCFLPLTSRKNGRLDIAVSTDFSAQASVVNE
jgi:hypothetical protein